LIDRYTREEMGEVFSDHSRFSHWLRIEILAVEARAARGDVPQEDLETIRTKAAFDVGRIKEIERKTRHDVAAFVDNVSENIGPAARHLHYGMTSSDVLDTAFSLQLGEAADLLLRDIHDLVGVTAELAKEHQASVTAGRTHGIHAEPTTFGLKAAGWAFELERGLKRLRSATLAIKVGKLSGAVGTYSQLDPQIEKYVCDKLGLKQDSASTQVISRDRHAQFICALALVAATLERIAVEIRHLTRTEVGEVEEPFAEGEQKGSSAMPHKRNPWRSERMVGLARVVRSAVGPALEDVALWHERDISHSSVERIVFPDACIALDFMLAEAIELLEGLVIYPDRMRHNMDASYGVLFSQNILLKLIDQGLSRDEAYRLVQESATSAVETKTHLRQVLGARPETSSLLSTEEIEQCFDETRYVAHAGEIIQRLESLGMR